MLSSVGPSQADPVQWARNRWPSAPFQNRYWWPLGAIATPGWDATVPNCVSAIGPFHFVPS